MYSLSHPHPRTHRKLSPTRVVRTASPVRENTAMRLRDFQEMSAPCSPSGIGADAFIAGTSLSGEDVQRRFDDEAEAREFAKIMDNHGSVEKHEVTRNEGSFGKQRANHTIVDALLSR